MNDNKNMKTDHKIFICSKIMITYLSEVSEYVEYINSHIDNLSTESSNEYLNLFIKLIEINEKINFYRNKYKEEEFESLGAEIAAEEVIEYCNMVPEFFKITSMFGDLAEQVNYGELRNSNDDIIIEHEIL